jgi:predicted dehydrogenase
MAEKKACWGLLSTARINERLIPALRASGRSELLAVASRSTGRAQAYAKQWDIPHAYGTYQQMLADPAINVIYLSLPNHLHVEWAIKCAEAGKHVLCEKPIAITTEEVTRMAQAAEKNGVIIQEAAMTCFHPQTRYLRELVAKRTIGEVRLIRGVFTFTLENPGDIRLDANMGGGSLWDLGSYCVSFARTVLQTEPIEVSAYQVSGDTGVDLSFSAQMQFPTGTLVQFFSSFQSFAHIEADFLGTEGRIYADIPWANHIGASANVQVTRSGNPEETSTFSDSMEGHTIDTKTYENMNAYQCEIDSMVESVLNGTEPVISLADSWKNVSTIVALHESARTGKPVRPATQNDKLT